MAFSIITRGDARAQGLKRYFSGIPCKRGHVCERQVSNLTCMSCASARCREHYDPNKNRVNGKRWRAANVEKVKKDKREYNRSPKRKAYAAAWFQANKERTRPAKLARYVEQRAERVAYSKAWAEANPDRFAEHMRLHARKRRAQKHNSGGTHTAADLAEILKAQGHRCAYCRADLRKTKRHVDHITPLATGGSNGRANLQYLCRPCNQSKSARDPIAFAQSIGLLL